MNKNYEAIKKVLEDGKYKIQEEDSLLTEFSTQLIGIAVVVSKNTLFYFYYS